jgi:enoyl-CoA hydratase/carnithine racemase
VRSERTSSTSGNSRNPQSQTRSAVPVTETQSPEPFEQIGYDVAGRVLTITLDNPAQRNAYGPDMEREMRAALVAGNQDPNVRTIIITGAGDSFCVGADMSVLEQIGTDLAVPSLPESEDADQSYAIESNYQRRFTYMLRIGTPLIAAINGPIAGVGVSISLFCDFRFMVDGAKMSTSFSRRGLIAEHGTSWMLSRLIGTSIPSPPTWQTTRRRDRLP